MTSLNLPVDAGTNETVSRLYQKLLDRRIRNYLRKTYYDSKQRIRDLVQVVPPIYQSYGFALGWSAKAVDALARRCALEDFVWPDGDLDSLGYKEWSRDNRVVVDAGRAVTDSLKYGPAFFVMTAGADGEPKSLLMQRNALSMVGEWNHRRRELDAALSVDREEYGVVLALTLYLPGRTLVAARDNGGARWQVGWADHKGLGILAEPITYRPDGDRPLGRSRITRPMMALQDAALRGLPRMEGHLDAYSFPEYWMLGADASIFRNADGSQMDAFRIRLGRIKGIPDDEDATQPRADVKQFPGSDPSPHLQSLNALAKLFAREASLPDSAVAISDMANPTSAESYDASQYELIAEAEGAIRDWRPAFRAVALKGLAIQNGLTSVPDEWGSLDTVWRDPRYQSKAQQADAGMKQLSAVPWLGETEIGLELLGLTSQQVERAYGERRRKAASDLLAGLEPGASTVADTREARAIAEKAQALRFLITAGVTAESAAAMVGLTGLEFSGAVPVSLRVPEADAGGLESRRGDGS